MSKTPDMFYCINYLQSSLDIIFALIDVAIDDLGHEKNQFRAKAMLRAIHDRVDDLSEYVGLWRDKEEGVA